MEMLQLKYFRHVATTENISHTAQAFMVPPSSVSASIKKLENELGVVLFDRTSNKLKLNSNGKIFLRAVSVSEKEIKKAKIDMLNLSSKPYGEVKLLILTNRSLVTDAVVTFKSEYPETSFSISHEEYDDYAYRNKFDIIISDKHIKHDAFRRRPFVREELFLAVHKSSTLAALNCITFKNLSDEKFICMPKGSSLREYMLRVFKNVDIFPDIAIECNDPFYVCEYLKAGLGVSFFPGISWSRYVDSRIRLIRINDGIYRNSYMYINNSSSNIARIFAETLELNSQKYH